MFDIESKYLEEIKIILKKHFPFCEVRAFGSRVKDNAKKYSDLDLVLISKDKIDWRKIEEIKQAFSETDIPFMIDILDWNVISEDFRKNILSNSEIIQF